MQAFPQHCKRFVFRFIKEPLLSLESEQLRNNEDAYKTLKGNWSAVVECIAYYFTDWSDANW
jgi:hypothetical protein